MLGSAWGGCDGEETVSGGWEVTRMASIGSKLIFLYDGGTVLSLLRVIATMMNWIEGKTAQDEIVR